MWCGTCFCLGRSMRTCDSLCHQTLMVLVLFYHQKRPNLNGAAKSRPSPDRFWSCRPPAAFSRPADRCCSSRLLHLLQPPPVKAWTRLVFQASTQVSPTYIWKSTIVFKRNPSSSTLLYVAEGSAAASTQAVQE